MVQRDQAEYIDVNPSEKEETPCILNTENLLLNIATLHASFSCMSSPLSEIHAACSVLCCNSS